MDFSRDRCIQEVAYYGAYTLRSSKYDIGYGLKNMEYYYDRAVRH